MIGHGLRPSSSWRRTPIATRSTTTNRPGDLVLVGFPYAGSAQTKQRPALITLDSGDADVVVARVTTQLHQTPKDVAIANWQGAGLMARSVIRTHKLATLEKALIRRHLGRLRPADRRRVASEMLQTYGTW